MRTSLLPARIKWCYQPACKLKERKELKALNSCLTLCSHRNDTTIQRSNCKKFPIKFQHTLLSMQTWSLPQSTTRVHSSNTKHRIRGRQSQSSTAPSKWYPSNILFRVLQMLRHRTRTGRTGSKVQINQHGML